MVMESLPRTKECEVCSSLMRRSYKAKCTKNPKGFYYRCRSDKQWKEARFCSQECFGKVHSKTMKGHIPWNKDKTYSEDLKKKFSEAQKGKKYHNRSKEHLLKLKEVKMGDKKLGNYLKEQGFPSLSKLLNDTKPRKK